MLGQQFSLYEHKCDPIRQCMPTDILPINFENRINNDQKLKPASMSHEINTDPKLA